MGNTFYELKLSTCDLGNTIIDVIFGSREVSEVGGGGGLTMKMDQKNDYYYWTSGLNKGCILLLLLGIYQHCFIFFLLPFFLYFT